MVPSPSVCETAVPRADRRSLVQRALGIQPMLYRSEGLLPQVRPEQERVHIYVDVSGSVEDLKGPLYGAVLDCQELVHPTVHLFSTEVADLTLAQVRAGLCRSTGGTDIACVTRHMARHKVRRAVVLTDGYVGCPNAQGAQVLRAARLGVAYVGDGVSERDLGPFTDVSVKLNLELGRETA